MNDASQEQDDVYRLLRRHLDEQAVGFPSTGSDADIRFLAGMFTPDEALALLQKNEDEGLVLQPANERQTEFVCSCCCCCCGMLRFQKMLPNPLDFWTTNFFAVVNNDSCVGCGVCVKRCQVNAVSHPDTSGAAEVNRSRCIGCGLCIPTCPKKAISLVKKTPETVPPKDEEELYDTINANRVARLG